MLCRFDALDVGNALRPTILSAGKEWTLRAQPSLLAPPNAPRTLRAEEQRSERARTLDLIDALTRSGALRLEDATLHVVLAATHSFDKGLVETVVQDSVNPIDAVERSSLIMGSCVCQRPAAELVKAERLAASQALSPALFAPGQ
mmetsp:Transcript_19018/g.52359  ORF Transcript_19018/g.52359 Transcript_19018/m.52359 type:complete len:145 (+) Transcript_19018:659-1093(+)